MLINNNKFVDSNQILNQEIKIKILSFQKKQKLDICFKIKLGS